MPRTEYISTAGTARTTSPTNPRRHTRNVTSLARGFNVLDTSQRINSIKTADNPKVIEHVRLANSWAFFLKRNNRQISVIDLALFEKEVDAGDEEVRYGMSFLDTRVDTRRNVRIKGE